MKHLFNAADRALFKLNEELEAQAIAATVRMSKTERNKNKECGFVCAMGGWFWFIEEQSGINPPANKTWQKAYDKYKYAFMVQSIKVICKNGKIISKLRHW